MADAWDSSWFSTRAGIGCPLCAEGRPDDPPRGPRFWAGNTADAYLMRRGIQRGWAVVIWRGHHAVELSDLERPELHAFMGEVAAVEAAMREHFAAIKMNVSFLGNQHPHLHAIIACRYDADIAPGRPIPVAPGEQFDATLLDRDCRALASRLAEASAI